MLVGVWPVVVGDRVPGQGLVSSSGCREGPPQPVYTRPPPTKAVVCLHD